MKIQLMPDTHFQKGFTAMGLMDKTESHEPVGQLVCGHPEETPRWRLCAWCSRFSFADPTLNTVHNPAEGIYLFENPSKRVHVDTNQGMIGLDLMASKVYDRPRPDLDTPWAHLLIETDFTSMENPATECRLCNLSSLQMSMQCRLVYFQGDRSVQDDEIHAAQFVFFLVIQNRNPKSEGYGEMIWFSIPVFDNRHEMIERSIAYDAGTKALMVSVDPHSYLSETNNFWRDGRIAAGPDSPWVQVKADILAELKDAYQQARQRGYIPHTQFEDLYVGGMNTGWEIPGVYDARMDIKDLRLDGVYEGDCAPK